MANEANPAFSMSAFAEFFALQNGLLGVPVFDGKTPDLGTFFQDLETAELKVPAALKNEFIKNVIARLRDSARDSAEGKLFDSIAGLVSHLKEALSPAVRDFDAYFAELSRAKMERNETVAKFGSRLQTIVRFLKFFKYNLGKFLKYITFTSFSLIIFESLPKLYFKNSFFQLNVKMEGLNSIHNLGALYHMLLV